MPSLRIDVFLDELGAFPPDAVIVGVDVIRSTTTAITAVAGGRRCFVAASLDEVAQLQPQLEHPLLVGELGGNMPYGFDLNNSPAAIARQGEPERPAILLSTSGTRLLSTASATHATTLVACLRNWAAQAGELVRTRPADIVLLGAGTRGEFREEDQLCCAWIAGPLVDAGYDADDETRRVIDAWRGAPVGAITEGKSARYLRDSGQLADLEFILEHVNDLPTTYETRAHEVVAQPGAASPA